MNREIKFRAWYNNELTYFNLFNIRSDGYLRSMDIEDGRPIMQYTGLKDSEGREIYEGDILHTTTDDLKIIGVVEWMQEYCAFGITDKDGKHVFNEGYLMPTNDLKNTKVIGTIYENKELLEGNNG